jgi:methylated-DNA-[protein]-cysteine S-methyltransferase
MPAKKIKLTGTEFEKKVWRAVQKIPYGQTRSYEQIAAQVGNRKAVRAVARALAKNKYPLLIPCHRVIGKNGKLTGYAWGLKLKRARMMIRKK